MLGMLDWKNAQIGTYQKNIEERSKRTGKVHNLSKDTFLRKILQNIF